MLRQLSCYQLWYICPPTGLRRRSGIRFGWEVVALELKTACFSWRNRTGKHHTNWTNILNPFDRNVKSVITSVYRRRSFLEEPLPYWGSISEEVTWLRRRQQIPHKSREAQLQELIRLPSQALLWISRAPLVTDRFDFSYSVYWSFQLSLRIF